MTRPVRTKPQELRAAFRGERITLVWIFLGSVCVNLLMLTGPLYMLAIYDQVLISGSIDLLTALTLLVLGLFSLMGVLDYCRGRIMSRFGARFQSRLDVPVLRKMLAGRSEIGDGDQKASMIRHLDALQYVFQSPALIAIMDMPWAPLFIAAIFVLHPALGWLALAGAVVIVSMTILGQRMTARHAATVHRKSQHAHRVVSEMLGAKDVIRAHGMQDTLLDRHVAARDDVLIPRLKVSDWSGLFASSSKAFRLFLQSAILGYGAYFVILGELTAGAIIAGSILLGRALAPVEQTMAHWAALQRARIAWSELNAFFANDAPTLSAAPKSGPDIRLHVENLTVVPTGSTAPVIEGIGFELAGGQVLGVIGESGSGKTTLAKCLTGAWPATTGAVSFQARTQGADAPDKAASRIGYLPQIVHFFSGTIAENIRHMSIGPDRRGVMDATMRAQAHRMIMTLPKGYDTHLDGNENLLSGGQRQRVGLAIALYGNPDLLVLDEPNSMLDAAGSRALNETIRQVRDAGKLVILMTHRPQAIKECDMLLVLRKGRMHAFGPREDVFNKLYPTNQKIRDLALRKAP